MATTYYMSITGVTGTYYDVDNVGTSSTSADAIELRMGNGTYSPSRREVLEAILRFHRFLTQGGLNGAGANLPLDSNVNNP